MSHNDGGWIGVDLDGTLAQYDGWQGPEHIGDPVPAMLGRVKEWLAAGREVRVLTARVHSRTSHNNREHARNIITAWCVKHVGLALIVTSEKDYAMIELWDDRCVQIEPNTGRRMDGKED